MGEKPLCTKTQLHMQHIRNTHNLTSVELSLNPSIRSRSIPSGTITATIGKAVGKKTFGSSIIIVHVRPPVMIGQALVRAFFMTPANYV